MIQEVQTYHDLTGAKVLWLKGCECIMTENVQKDRDRKAVNCHNRKGANGSWSKGCEINPDQKDANGSWPWQKGYKWVMTESVQMSYDRKRANGLWSKGCKWSCLKDWKWSWLKGCKWIVTEKLQTRRDQRVFF